jgi:hypothetical protein
MMTYSFTASSVMSPFPIVFAIWTSNTSAAMRLKKAAQSTAIRGVSTRVETIVAIEFAASWKPLRKSKTSARSNMRMTSVSMGIGFVG